MKTSAAVLTSLPRLRPVLSPPQASTTKTAIDYKQPESHVFWSAGLDGTGEIVGIGDSGIDMDSCFFSDPAVPFVAPVGSKEWANPQHRKVVYYWGLADDTFKDLVGHGTHTSGSVAGFNPAAPDSKATGAAKGAKLAFVDLSRTAGGDVNAPQDLESNYFPKMHDKGACIFTGVSGVGSLCMKLLMCPDRYMQADMQGCIFQGVRGPSGSPHRPDRVCVD
jgi:subtilisin family serine protease